MPNFTGKDKLNNKIDFIACLGGDGTLLYASSLFQVSLFNDTLITLHVSSIIVNYCNINNNKLLNFTLDIFI